MITPAIGAAGGSLCTALLTKRPDIIKPLGTSVAGELADDRGCRLATVAWNGSRSRNVSYHRAAARLPSSAITASFRVVNHTSHWSSTACTVLTSTLADLRENTSPNSKKAGTDNSHRSIGRSTCCNGLPTSSSAAGNGTQLKALPLMRIGGQRATQKSAGTRARSRRTPTRLACPFLRMTRRKSGIRSRQLLPNSS